MCFTVSQKSDSVVHVCLIQKKKPRATVSSVGDWSSCKPEAASTAFQSSRLAGKDCRLRAPVPRTTRLPAGTSTSSSAGNTQQQSITFHHSLKLVVALVPTPYFYLDPSALVFSLRRACAMSRFHPHVVLAVLSALLCLSGVWSASQSLTVRVFADSACTVPYANSAFDFSVSEYIRACGVTPSTQSVQAGFIAIQPACTAKPDLNRTDLFVTYYNSSSISPSSTSNVTCPDHSTTPYVFLQGSARTAQQPTPCFQAQQGLLTVYAIVDCETNAAAAGGAAGVATLVMSALIATVLLCLM